MRWLFVLTCLAGCDRVFGLDDRPPGVDAAAGDTVVNLCAGGSHGGNGGMLGVCLEAAPAEVLSRDADIVTGRNMQDECMQIVTQADANQTEVCVLAARRIEISSAIRASGNRPLVLLALDELVVTGTLDVSSRPQQAPPAGAGYQGCVLSGTSGTARTTGGGGGAGGTFAALGGVGGTGSSGATTAAGGVPAASDGVGVVRGGCRGGIGGAGDTGMVGGFSGEGGGAIYLIAGRTITIRGTINASGGGGDPAQATSIGGGGGGGGSGGLIGLDAPSIVLEPTAILVANGGGGAGGNGAGTGANGAEPDLVAGSFPFVGSGGTAGPSGGGAGGAGGTAPSPSGSMGESATGGGGGCGGGVGQIVIFAAQRDLQSGARISPAPGP